MGKRAKTTTISNKELIKELKFDLFWYNIIISLSCSSLLLRLIWTIRKNWGKEDLYWELPILTMASLSFCCYWWMRRKKIIKELKLIK